MCLVSEATSGSAEKVPYCIISSEQWHVTHVLAILQANSPHDGYDGGRINVSAAPTSLTLQIRCISLKFSRTWENRVLTFNKHENPANNQVLLLVIHDAQIKLTLDLWVINLIY